MDQPKVIFLDAVGTLFGIQGSVGEVYSQLARQFGVEVSAPVLDQAFRQSFQASDPAAFPGASLTEIPALEFQWWQAIATQTFERAGVLHAFANFSDFFTKLYAHFATAKPWFVYADVQPTLEKWQHQGIELGVLSNFDSRLYSVLQSLELAHFFQSITISTEVGAAKPSLTIFQAALQKHGYPPNAAWHIGDSYEEDYQGAESAGLQGVWLKRADDSIPTKISNSVLEKTPTHSLKSHSCLTSLSDL